ncbi:hypothetical protein NQ317_015781 [Molorchus minor]|uniref:Sm domain-containing protein n=1 Tax=Molorchus minor TaxID=1323400 RepID=A0ABQ9J426_9CUCU|nr:hypothetical protein NQ317_015781 [Molorchus minor]
MSNNRKTKTATASAKGSGTSFRQSRDTKKDKYYFLNSLAGIVKALEGKYTIVDLRNDSCVTGKIVQVHGRMNIEMEDVVYYDSKGNEYVFSSFFLSERNIRYVHIPKRTSSTKLIKKQLRTVFFKPKTQKQKKTFKGKRAENYNEKILQEAYAKK